MDQNNPYFKQVKLLVSVLPIVAKQECFALKGGTAINLFVHNLPRLSVDIDLCYVPLKARDESLAEIHQSMKALEKDLLVLNLNVTESILGGTDIITRLIVDDGQSRIKIEISPVLRGTVHPVKLTKVCEQVEMQFGFAEIHMLDENDLYAGKLCAALDRQHPRDLYDVKKLLEAGDISEALKNTFLVYLMSHNRPMAEVLSPNLQPLEEIFAAEFDSMTQEQITVGELERVRDELIAQIHAVLTDNDRQFLLSVKEGSQNWQAFHYPDAQYLPSIKWKLHNLQQMKDAQRKTAVEKLKAVLCL